MSERKEKTMLKWLKQKPTHGHGGLPIEKITDDPLATIQVHPHAKKSKNKANEIYAVSRVNPLFEEEDGKEVFSPGGNSGSSGYDSGSGPSDDDFPIISNVATDLKDLQATILGRLSSSSSSSTVALASSSNNNPSNIHALASKHPQLFINTENDVIHHEAAIVGPNGRPILQILEQNPNYVKSIALSVANNGRKRPLSPISESTQQQQNANIAPMSPTISSSAQQLNTHMMRSNSVTAGGLHNDAKSTITLSKLSHYNTVDAIGSAKLVKKDSQFVRSIRIGTPVASNTGGTKRSILEANRRFSSSSSSSSSGPSRRPSVTFADDVGPTGSRPGSRKPSVEQDSIVTESLLMMTSHGTHDPARRFANASTTSNNSSSTPNSSRKTSVSSSQSKSQDELSTTTETDIVSSEQDTVDLEAFANSLRKSRPIKQLSSPTIKAHIRSQGSSGNTEDLDDTSSSSSNPSEGYDSTSPPNERRAPPTLDRSTEAASPTTSPSTRIHTSKIHKSPFGGIADHYAAAKEIAKEIESYSNGSAKASSKKSLVRDLLYRGNRNASSSVFSNYEALNAIKASSNSNPSNTIKSNLGYGTNNSKNGFRTGRNTNGNNRDGTLTKDPRHPTSSSSSIPQQTFDQQVALSASANYFDSSCYGPAVAKNGSTTDRRVAPASNNTSTTHHQNEKVTTLRGGGSNDWELVRVQQVYVKAAGSSSQEQLTGQKLRKNGTVDTITSSNKDSSGRTVGHQGQDRSSTGASTNSRLPIPSSSLASTSKPKASSSSATSSSINTGRGKANASKKVPIVDDGLPTTTGARQQKPHDDKDSGNSSDRTYAEVRLEIEGTKIDFPGEKITDSTSQVEDESTRPENLPSKVMIVTGDSQNIVVDLSGVPLDLKNAIVSGTALITLPDGLEKLLQPGYTMITIPASKPLTTKSSSAQDDSTVTTTATNKGSNPTGGTRNNLSKKDGAMNITIGIDDDKPLVPTGAGSSSSDDECKLFSMKNKSQIWDVIQQTMGKQQDAGGGGKGKKKITTVFPFHPNQDAYESPDFTIDGHRLDRQRKKVEMGKKRRCACRLCGMLFFLVAFLGVLVALSMIYTKGQRYFGSV